MTATRGLSGTRIAGLDGIRALAVVAVLIYHLDTGALPGGFLGVDVFFVLSGYLITTLLLEEWAGTGSLDLGGFWRRRARRLLPPLILTLVAVAVVTPALYDDVAGRVRGELLSGLAQVSNWFQALAGRSYFDEIGRQSPLQHLWSLGVEAQFYLVWPLVAVLAVRHLGRAGVARVAAGGAAMSFLAMAVFYRSGSDPSRLYYGTDTRMGTLLVGAALAVVWPVSRLRPTISARARGVVDGAGVAAIAGLTLLALRLDGTSAAAYRGGLLLAALLAAVVLAATVHPGARLGRVLAVPPLVWAGTRSYAIYLWHWPVITATRPDLDIDVHGWALLALRLALIAGLAEGTVRAIDAVLTASRAGVAVRRRLVLVTAALLAGTVSLSVRTPTPTPVFFVSPTTTVALPPPTQPPATSTTLGVPDAGPTTAPTTVAPALPPATTPPVPAGPPMRVVAVGESVLLGAGGEVQRAFGPGTLVDAAISRQPDDVLDALRAQRDAGHLQDVEVLVVQLGSNGEVKGRHLDRLASLAEGVRRVVAVTVRVDRPWEGPSNDALRAGVERHPWLALADWHALALQHPEWLGPDGVHPGREGARQYAALVAAAARGTFPAVSPPTTAAPPPPPPTTTTAPPPPVTEPPAPAPAPTTTAPPPDLPAGTVLLDGTIAPG